MPLIPTHGDASVTFFWQALSITRFAYLENRHSAPMQDNCLQLSCKVGLLAAPDVVTTGRRRWPGTLLITLAGPLTQDCGLAVCALA
jgi:hypothetical protein